LPESGEVSSAVNESHDEHPTTHDVIDKPEVANEDLTDVRAAAFRYDPPSLSEATERPCCSPCLANHRTRVEDRISCDELRDLV